MTVYADILFLVNFIMDSFVLWIVSQCVRKKTHPLWLLAGGLLMALLYCLVIFTAAFRYMPVWIASLLILAMGVTLALHPSGVKSFIKMVCIAYIVSFTVGGLGMMLFYLTDIPYAAYYLTTNPSEAGGFSWKLPVVCIVGSYAVIKLGLRAVERFTMKRRAFCPVRVCMGLEEVRFDALVDTGHSLREPITQAPVIVAEFEYIKPFLPDGLRLLFYEKQENDLCGLLAESEAPFYQRVRMIPFTSLGRDNGMLIGFRPDRVTVGDTQTERSDVVIGIYNSRFTRDGRYQALLGPELVIP